MVMQRCLRDDKPTIGALVGGVSGKPSVWVDLLKLAQSFPVYGNNMDASLSFQHNTTINAYFCALFGTNEFEIVEWCGLPDSLKDPLDHVCIIELTHLAECLPSDLSEAQEYEFYDWEYLMRLAESTAAELDRWLIASELLRDCPPDARSDHEAIADAIMSAEPLAEILNLPELNRWPESYRWLASKLGAIEKD